MNAVPLITKTLDEPLADDVAHWQVLRLLELNPRLSQRELSAALGVSLGKTNYCLHALLDKGLLKIQNFQNSNRKWAYAYILTPEGLVQKAVLTAKFLQRKKQEYELLRAEIDALQCEMAAMSDKKPF